MLQCLISTLLDFKTVDFKLDLSVIDLNTKNLNTNFILKDFPYVFGPVRSLAKNHSPSLLRALNSTILPREQRYWRRDGRPCPFTLEHPGFPGQMFSRSDSHSAR